MSIIYLFILTDLCSCCYKAGPNLSSFDCFLMRWYRFSNKPLTQQQEQDSGQLHPT